MTEGTDMGAPKYIPAKVYREPMIAVRDLLSRQEVDLYYFHVFDRKYYVVAHTRHQAEQAWLAHLKQQERFIHKLDADQIMRLQNEALEAATAQ